MYVNLNKRSKIAHILHDTENAVLCTGLRATYLYKFDTLPENNTVCANCRRIHLRNSAIQIIVNEEVQVSIADVLKAIDENGFKHVHGEWFSYDTQGNIIAGCILGQAAINLGIDSDSLTTGLNEFGAATKIISFNDFRSYNKGNLRGYKAVAKMAHNLLDIYVKNTFTAKRTIYRAKKKKVKNA